MEVNKSRRHSIVDLAMGNTFQYLPIISIIENIIVKMSDTLTKGQLKVILKFYLVINN